MVKLIGGGCGGQEPLPCDNGGHHAPLVLGVLSLQKPKDQRKAENPHPEPCEEVRRILRERLSLDKTFNQWVRQETSYPVEEFTERAFFESITSANQTGLDWEDASANGVVVYFTIYSTLK